MKTASIYLLYFKKRKENSEVRCLHSSYYNFGKFAPVVHSTFYNSFKIYLNIVWKISQTYDWGSWLLKPTVTLQRNWTATDSIRRWSSSLQWPRIPDNSCLTSFKRSGSVPNWLCNFHVKKINGFLLNSSHGLIRILINSI